MTEPFTIDRRRLLRMSALGGAGLIVGPTFASALGVTRVSASGTTEPAALTDLNVQLGWLATVENAGEFVAASKGFYADEGLNPTLTPGGPGAILEPTVVPGAALIGLSSADTIALANAEGAGLKIVGVHVAAEPFGGDVAWRPTRCPTPRAWKANASACSRPAMRSIRRSSSRRASTPRR